MIIRTINILLSFLIVGTVNAQTLKKYEYWIDSDYGNRTQVATSTEENTFKLSLDNQTTGVHTLNIRTLGNDNIWGAPTVGLFFIPAVADDNPEATGYECWFDDDVEGRVASTTNDATISRLIDISTLASGVHYFSFRVKNSDGIYGSLCRSIFYIPAVADDNRDVAGYEYWFDDNYADRVRANSSDNEISRVIDISKLTTGVHYYSVRAKNTDGVWGAVKRNVFYVPAEPDKASRLGGYEYWIDDDYAHRVSSFSTNANVNLKVNLTELSKGVHYFTFRERDTNKQWSAPYRSIFYVGTPETTNVGNIIAYRYQFNNKTTYVALPEEKTSYSIDNLVVPFPEINEFAVVGEESNFIFEDNLVTLKRKVNATFNIQFEDKAHEWTMPVFKSFDIDDELQKVPVNLKMEGSVLFDKFLQGDYYALKINVDEGGYYYFKSTQAANILLYKDGEIYNDIITPDELKECVMVGMDAGTYYAIIYNTVRDAYNTDNCVGLMMSSDYISSISDIMVASPSINAKGYGTFSSKYNVQITGAKVYKAKLNSAGDKLVCEEVVSGMVPAGNGVILYSEGTTEATTATALYVESADAIEDNGLKGTTLADGSLAPIEPSLVLSGSSFVSYTGTAFVHGKAYLPYNEQSQSKALTIVFDGGTTGIDGVIHSTDNKNVIKKVKNGNLVISVDGVEYNAVGTRLK